MAVRNIDKCLRPLTALQMIQILWDENSGYMEHPFIKAFIKRHNEENKDYEEMQINSRTSPLFIARQIAEMCLDDNF